MYDSETLCLEPYREEKELCSEYVDKAKKDMTRFLGKDVMEHPPVRDFLLMKMAMRSRMTVRHII